MIALVAIAVSAVGWLSYRNLEQALLPRVLDRIETHSRFIAAELDSHVRSGPGDITTFQGLAAVSGVMRARLNGGIDPVDQTTEAVWRERARSLQRRVDDFKTQIARLEGETKQLEGDFYRWDDGQYRDRVIKPAWDKKREELETARIQSKQAEADRAAYFDQ